jgi:hypothetical protein
MKNLHILPTDKPSRIGQSVFNKSLHFNSIFNYELEKERVIPQNIYITSDIEIKEGDYSFYPPFGLGRNIIINGELCFHIEVKNGVGSFTQKTYQTLDLNKKIILTTDQDLIKDGVQAIDDEFLEWFVNNPSCEEVDIEKCGYMPEEPYDYKLIIPKEECKLELDCPYDFTSRCTMGRCNCKPKQETLEEASWKFNSLKKLDGEFLRVAFIKGAKWQQERSYSEEEVLKIITEFKSYLSFGDEVNEEQWFEQFKKKV